jgi:acyl carrier protein
LFDNVRQFLKKELPEYMIPSVFISLKEIPLTANGKIDRAKLLEIIPGENAVATAEYIAPFTEEEQRLAAIWTQILGVEKIGIKDNFFELGGDSIKIIKMLRLIEQDYPGIIQIGNLFDSPTIEQLSIIISNAKGQKEEQKENPLRIVEF